jgi:hypothetical protein
MGNEQADAFCTVIRLSTPSTFQLSTDEGWRIIKRLLEWIRVKCRHYWLLQGIAGFGAAYRGTLFVRDGNQISYQNVALYGPNVVVNPLSLELWSSMAFELETKAELPLADSIYCDSLLSIVAGDVLRALLAAGVAMEVALTRLLVDVSAAQPSSPAKISFMATWPVSIPHCGIYYIAGCLPAGRKSSLDSARLGMTNRKASGQLPTAKKTLIKSQQFPQRLKPH